ncbi:hypothetical protein B0H11DRAFT_1929195 [Mycena galericulata]|nr:hypothetical protein B0H11DRAFT_1929195 [Mycena galericulata]
MATSTALEDLPNPRTSTPPRESTADVTVPEFDASTEFEESPLQDYDGPVDDEVIVEATPVQNIHIVVPTFRPFSKLGLNSAIIARRQEALLKGANPTGKGFLLTAPKVTRRFYTSLFPRELDMLDTVLTDVERLELVDGTYGYRVNKDQYKMLLRMLYDLRRLAEDAFRLEGKTPPGLPSWGDDEDITDVYIPNAFEILGSKDFSGFSTNITILLSEGRKVTHTLPVLLMIFLDLLGTHE